MRQENTWSNVDWYIPDSTVHGANMGPIWGRQDPGGPHVGPMNLAIRDIIQRATSKCQFRIYFVQEYRIDSTSARGYF